MFSTIRGRATGKGRGQIDRPAAWTLWKLIFISLTGCCREGTIGLINPSRRLPLRAGFNLNLYMFFVHVNCVIAGREPSVTVGRSSRALTKA